MGSSRKDHGKVRARRGRLSGGTIGIVGTSNPQKKRSLTVNGPGGGVLDPKKDIFVATWFAIVETVTIA